MTDGSTLETRVDAWLADDPDPASRAEIERLRGDDPEQLAALFTGRIGFGTAGLRAAMGPGPTQMNRLVVRQTTLGLMRWLPEGALVVVGYDARHQSDEFAHDVARMVVHAGGRAELLDSTTPTPVLAHAVLQRNADAGVMVTASHNPPADNGYKLYLGDGIQLVAPADAEIAAAIDLVAAEPMPSIDEEATDAQIVSLGSSVSEAHIDAACAALMGSARDVSVVYTAMHGVGGQHLCRAFEQAGFAPPTVVPEQFDPDPDFPTASFPNPEEDGALDLGLALASEIGADVLMANDPDADRLAIAVPARDGGGFTPLSGDQLGALLADHLLRATSEVAGDRVVAMSIVSSRLMESMAAAAGAHCEVTLTGFKWVARPIVERPDATFVFGYEEAIGYCCGDRVRDKDGISAALVTAELLAVLKLEGETVWDRLDALALEHGAHLTGPVTIRFDGADGNEKRQATMDRVLANPPGAVGDETVGEETLASSLDLSKGETLPPATGLVLHYSGGTRVIVRPSGTEPKLKAYVEVIEPSGDWDAARQRLLAIQAQLSELLR